MGNPASFVTAASEIGTNTFLAAQTIATTAGTTGARTALTVTGAADTGVTASTEQTDVYINLARTVTWAAGALTTQRAVRIAAPTYAFASASTITTAVTLDVSGAPAAGTNATITNAYAFRVAAGASLLGLGRRRWRPRLQGRAHGHEHDAGFPAAAHDRHATRRHLLAHRGADRLQLHHQQAQLLQRIRVGGRHVRVTAESWRRSIPSPCARRR